MHNGRTDGRKLIAIPLAEKCIVLAVTLTFEPENLFNNSYSYDEYLCPSFIEIPPLSTEILRHVTNGRPAGRPKTCPRLLLLSEA